MLRGSEVSKDSYHSPVKKIKTIKNLQTESDRQRTIYVCHATTSLEQSAGQSQTMWAVIRPVQAVTEDIFIRTMRPQHSVNCF